MTRFGRRTYLVIAGTLLALMVVVDILAKLGPLGDWSAVFDIVVNLLLAIGAIAAVVAAQRRENRQTESDYDNDY